MREKKTWTDEARLGLAREVLEIIFGLEKETEDRVMRLIRGSIDSQDVRTPEMRQRLGPRAMKYLTNAIDLARSEGAELHDADPDFDLGKKRRGDLEPGHKHRLDPDAETSEMSADDDMRENFTFKDFLLNEVTAMIDVDDPDAMAKLKQKQRMDPRQVAARNAAQVQDTEQAAKDAPPSPRTNLEMQKAKHLKAIAALDKRLAMLRDREGA